MGRFCSYHSLMNLFACQLLTWYAELETQQPAGKASQLLAVCVAFIR
jgi:hypothetical protein